MKGISAGALDIRLQFQRAEMVDDGLANTETWADHGAPVWASKTDVSDGERWRASQVAAGLTTRFLVRWSAFSADITPADRLVCEGRTYNIIGRKEGDGRRRWIELTCAAIYD